MRFQMAGMLLVVLATGALEGQAAGSGRSGRRALMPREQEIALARSAAPPSVSDSARVLVLTDGGYQVAVPGSSGVTCLVNRSWPESVEPECFEGSATVLAVELYRTEQRHLGREDAAIEREIRFRNRPALGATRLRASSSCGPPTRRLPGLSPPPVPI